MPTENRVPQQQRSREKVARILAATGQLLESRPYEELGTKLIAAEAGVSIGVLYRFFPDKEAIVASLVRGWLDRFLEVFDRTAVEPLPGDPRELVRRLVDAYASFYRQEPGFRRVWFEGTGNVVLREEGDANDQQLADRLHELLVGRYGMPDSAKFRQRTLLTVVLVGHLLTQAFRGKPEGDQEVLDEAVVLVERYLLTP